MLIDTHSHIYDRAFDSDRDLVVARALEEGVERILLPAIDSKSHRALAELSLAYPDICLPMMGLHPTSVNDNAGWRDELALVESYLAEPSKLQLKRLYGVGEVGLDLHWSREWLSEQIEAFEIQIELSIRYSLPLAIHTRLAWREMVETLERYKDRGLRGVMHSFSGSYSDYVAIKDLGDFVFGVGGVVTYRNSEISELLPRMSLEDIVLETDSPYLTPVPFRGRRNESAYLRYICDAVALMGGYAREQVVESSGKNASRIFNIV